jgi:hypothetical protein
LVRKIGEELVGEVVSVEEDGLFVTRMTARR